MAAATPDRELCGTPRRLGLHTGQWLRDEIVSRDAQSERLARLQSQRDRIDGDVDRQDFADRPRSFSQVLMHWPVGLARSIVKFTM